MPTKLSSAFVLAMLALASSDAAVVNFTYSQTDATTGSGAIAPFSLGGHDFTATPLPSASVFNPGGAAPSGFVGSITGMSGNSNEGNQGLGLLWSGSVTATATDGATVQIPLVFVPKQAQSPTDVNDYTWNVTYGDSTANGVDAVGTGLRFAFYLSRDNVVDAVETPDTFQRYTQQTQNFLAGQDNLSNTDTTTTAIKDATDAGAPLGNDAAGRSLAFYWAWRDGGSLTGSILVNDFNVGGLLMPDETTLVPEPSTVALGIIGLVGFICFWVRRYYTSRAV